MVRCESGGLTVTLSHVAFRFAGHDDSSLSQMTMHDHAWRVVVARERGVHCKSPVSLHCLLQHTVLYCTF